MHNGQPPRATVEYENDYFSAAGGYVSPAVSIRVDYSVGDEEAALRVLEEAADNIMKRVREAKSWYDSETSGTTSTKA